MTVFETWSYNVSGSTRNRASVTPEPTMSDPRFGRMLVIRRFLGVTVIIVVLSLTVVESILPGVTVPPGRVLVLLSAAGALLGLDLVGKSLTERIFDVLGDIEFDIAFSSGSEDLGQRDDDTRQGNEDD